MVIAHANFFINFVIYYLLRRKLFHCWRMRTINEDVDSTSKRSYRKVLHLAYIKRVIISKEIWEFPDIYFVYLKYVLHRYCDAWWGGIIFVKFFILIFQNYLLGAFKPSCNISIAFSDGKTRKQVSHLQ